MSRLAQAVQREVEEMRRAAPFKRRRMDRDERAGGLPKDAEEFAPETVVEEAGVAETVPATTTTSVGDWGEMAKKKRMAKKATVKSKVWKTSKRKARTPAHGEGRVAKVYRLTGEIPETFRDGSAQRKMLEFVGKHADGVTYQQVQAEFPKSPTPTVRFYLGKWQREKIVTAK